MALLNLSTASGPAQLHAAVLGDGTFVEQQQPISGNVVGAGTATTIPAATATQVSFDGASLALLTSVRICNNTTNPCYLMLGLVGGTPVSASLFTVYLGAYDTFELAAGELGQPVQAYSPLGTTVTSQRVGTA